MTRDAPWAIVHVPHASRRVPADVRAELVLDDGELVRERDLLTDHYTDELFLDAVPGAASLVFPVSRLVVDPERFERDDLEPMAARGMGVLYTRTTEGRPLRRVPTPARREELLERYYRPHHRALEQMSEAAIARHGRVLIVDGHSFPDRPLPCDLDQKPRRPDICIGTDPVHTPTEVVDAVVERCRELGWSVETDAPYAGTLVPARYHSRDARVASVMIEVNRRLYLADEPNDVSRGADFDRVRRAVGELVACAVRAASVR